jgi:hypothetical protein
MRYKLPSIYSMGGQMTNDEIRKLAGNYALWRSDSDLLAFARALESHVLAERKDPIATIRRDGSIFHTQWHREMPELFKLDVYAEPITEPEHSAIYISQKLTGSTKDAAFIQAHINQAVSEAMEAHPTPDDRYEALEREHLGDAEKQTGIYAPRPVRDDAKQVIDKSMVKRLMVQHGLAHPTPDDASQWISVSERLPTWSDGRRSKTKVYVTVRTAGGVEKECGFFLAGPGGCFDDHDFSPLHRVTHWKPLDAAIDRAMQSGEEGKS